MTFSLESSPNDDDIFDFEIQGCCEICGEETDTIARVIEVEDSKRHIELCPKCLQEDKNYERPLE
jgi:ribosome-binding protein aMBF1 (putative translation factor)